MLSLEIVVWHCKCISKQKETTHKAVCIFHLIHFQWLLIYIFLQLRLLTDNCPPREMIGSMKFDVHGLITFRKRWLVSPLLVLSVVSWGFHIMSVVVKQFLLLAPLMDTCHDIHAFEVRRIVLHFAQFPPDWRLCESCICSMCVTLNWINHA